MSIIKYYHAHVYFDSTSIDSATRLCMEASDKFNLKIGSIHQKPVGPHPCWSCQLAFEPQVFGEVVPWLALNRSGLTIFIHPDTGDDYKDHTEHAMWMGEIKQLKLSMFIPKLT